MSVDAAAELARERALRVDAEARASKAVTGLRALRAEVDAIEGRWLKDVESRAELAAFAKAMSLELIIWRSCGELGLSSQDIGPAVQALTELLELQDTRLVVRATGSPDVGPFISETLITLLSEERE